MDGKEENELKDKMQYWYSKYCNTPMMPEREAYLGVYKALKVVYELKFKKNPAWNSCLVFSYIINYNLFTINS